MITMAKRKGLIMLGLILTLTIPPFVPVDATEPISFYSLPITDRDSYRQLGDINIGALIVTDFSEEDGCRQSIRAYASTIEQTEAVAFAVDYVNRNPHILPNITLGFVIRGTCRNVGPTLASSLLFIPPNVCPYAERNESSCAGRVPVEGNPQWLSDDVIGVMSTGWSSLTTPVSSLYSIAKLPLVAPTETSDELSDKRKHPYFFRIAPPQAYQVKAILKFINSFGWSYISVLYTDCTFSLTTVIDNVDQFGICIATMHQMTGSTNIDQVVTDLLVHSRARVVIVFISNTLFRKVLSSVVEHNAQGHFIWIGSNLIESYSGVKMEDILPERDPGIGTIYFDTYSRDIPEYFDHLRNINLYDSENVWLKYTWEEFFNCSIDAKTCDSDANLLLHSKYRTFKGTSLRAEAILTLAQAAHDLLSERCPRATGKEARDCIKGNLLREYMKNVDFDGFVTKVSFDENQDIKGRYTIKQIVYDYPSYFYLPNTTMEKKILGRKIGYYDISSGLFSFSDDVSWSHLNTLERIVPWTDGSPLSSEIPESVCSRPCHPGEYKMEKKVYCCWDCRRCRENERLVDGNTSCEACPSFTWPDPGLTTCVDIPPTYSALPDAIPLVLTCTAILALVMTVCVAVTYFFYRNERVIKASSRELSAIQLTAIFLGYSTVILFQTAPSDNLCRAIFFMFCMSFAMLYCPLMAKTSRIYRIFKSGAKNERPRFISPNSQILFSLSLIIVQITLCVSTFILYSPRAHRIQQVWTEKMVELSCDLTLPGLASFLAYNVVLVSVCSVFAFLTRKLPDNFNESKFISMCVSTTLLIWMAFTPTYFTASREFVRVFLMSIALILNHTVAIIFLFFPKIYAAIYLKEGGHVTDKAG